MLASAVRSAGLEPVLDEVFSIHPLMVFKTSPETYRMVTDYWHIERHAVSFQSSNRWDIAGATASASIAPGSTARGSRMNMPILPQQGIERPERSA